MDRKEIKGIMALVPAVFDEKRDPDIEGFKENIRYLEDVGMHGIICMASVGEYYQLSDKEWETYASAAVDSCRKMTCVVGTHYQNTREAIRRTKYAEDIGADGAMILPPYFSNWLDAEAVYNHYKSIHAATHDIQMMAYNWQACGLFFDFDLWARLLRDLERITAVKECTPFIEMSELIRRHGNRLNVLAGAEWGLLVTMILGGHGCVAVNGVAHPRFLLKFYDACVNKNWDKALDYHQQLAKHEWESRLSPERRYGYGKAIVEAAGKKAGPRREPFSLANSRTYEFHKKWLDEIRDMNR
jgi:4-hydroxy-tetrahydrodipicolinate synthase